MPLSFGWPRMTLSMSRRVLRPPPFFLAMIRRSEVVTPVADAVGFVDHDQADTAIGEDTPQRLAQRLGGDVQQLQLPAAQLSEHLASLGVAEGRVEQRRFEAEAFQGIHLVF